MYREALDGIAERLRTLEQENARLRAAAAELEAIRAPQRRTWRGPIAATALCAMAWVIYAVWTTGSVAEARAGDAASCRAWLSAEQDLCKRDMTDAARERERVTHELTRQLSAAESRRAECDSLIRRHPELEGELSREQRRSFLAEWAGVAIQ
jgi:hypothetical protein